MDGIDVLNKVFLFWELSMPARLILNSADFSSSFFFCLISFNAENPVSHKQERGGEL